jgi:hypothetical protein
MVNWKGSGRGLNSAGVLLKRSEKTMENLSRDTDILLEI